MEKGEVLQAERLHCFLWHEPHTSSMAEPERYQNFFSLFLWVCICVLLCVWEDGLGRHAGTSPREARLLPLSSSLKVYKTPGAITKDL